MISASSVLPVTGLPSLTIAAGAVTQRKRSSARYPLGCLHAAYELLTST